MITFLNTYQKLFIYPFDRLRWYYSISLSQTMTIYNLTNSSDNFDLHFLGNRLNNVVIQIGVEANNLVTVARHQTAIGAECTFRFEKPIRGRYVKIMLEITEYLQITEFQVFSKTRT
jgi:hypothetical protein